MNIFSKLFGPKPTSAQTESMLCEIEQLSKLQSSFPAVVRLKMLGEKAPRKLIGPGGPLHDRFVQVTSELARCVGSRPGEMTRITPAWDALPNVLHASINFHGGSLSPAPDQLVRALDDKTKKFVVLSSANSNIREQDPEKQMLAFFDLADHPHWSLALLIFSGSLIVRSEVIRLHPSALNPAKLDELFPKLCSAAENEGAIKVLR
jgi:hypothetical protein